MKIHGQIIGRLAIEWSENESRQLAEKQHQRKGHDQGVIHGLFDILGMDRTEQQFLHQGPDEKGQYHGRRYGQVKWPAGKGDDIVGQVSAKHVKFAMGEINDPHHAV